MKKIIILLISIFIIIVVAFSYNYFQFEKEKSEINKFNKYFLDYNQKNIYGTDITTVINRAMDNNKQYKIEKNEFDEFIPDENNSVKIFINLQEDGLNYPMEKLYKVGINRFTEYFGMLKFECNQVNFHENGKVSEMYFKAINN